MEHPTNASSLPPASRLWHCHFCDIDIHITQIILHIESPLHRLRAEGPLRANELGEMANPITGGDSEEESVCSDESESTDTEDAEVMEEEEVADEEDDELFHAMYHEQDDEISYEEKLRGEPRLPWTCVVCSTTVDTSRIEHLRSAPHLAAVLLQPSVAPAHPTSWTCTLCHTKMPIAHQEMHFGSKRHLKLIARQKPTPPAPKTDRSSQNLPTVTRTVKPRQTRSQPTPGPSEPWNCHRCGEPLYSVLLVSHLAWHCTKAPVKSRQRTPKQPSPPHPTGHLYCEVCKKYFLPSAMQPHLAGRKHTKKAAAQQQRTVPVPPDVSTVPRVALPVVAIPLRTVTTRNMPQRPVTTHGQRAGEIPAVQPVVHAVSAIPYITVTGKSFYCTVCVRTRMVKGMAAHVASWAHRSNVARQQRVVR